ncbi:MAG: hypothetical protein IPJ07_12870 [Acidobacteria bacterium]|nr:hypothetical protein [Acidobacteriota bacterium]
MNRKYAQIITLAIFASVIWYFSGVSSAQVTYPQPTNLNTPFVNWTEPNGCTRCHFTNGAGGDHMLEAVGVTYSDTKGFALSGNGWFASKHATTVYKSTQNTYCAKCHSPLQATNKSAFVNGFLQSTEMIADGKAEGVTCAACHPSKTAAVTLGGRLAIYQFEKDRAKPEAYKLIKHGEEDSLCLNCHITRHNENNPGFKRMYEAGVACMDCHMAPYAKITGTEVEKRFHDFKVASNLPFSCGAKRIDGRLPYRIQHRGDPRLPAVFQGTAQSMVARQEHVISHGSIRHAQQHEYVCLKDVKYSEV